MGRYPKAVLEILCGVAAIVFTWWYALKYGSFYIIVCFLGPFLLAEGIAKLVISDDEFFEPAEQDPTDPNMKRVDESKLSTLGYIFAGIGLVVGGFQFVVLKFGLH